MDLYTTSFTYPRPFPHALRPSSSPLPANLALPDSAALPSIPLPNVTTAPPPSSSPSSAPITTAAQVEKDWDAVQKLCLDITQREGCLVTVTREQSGVELGHSAAPPIPLGNGHSNGHGETETLVPATTLWNFHLSGGYQSVMSARGALLREAPRDNRTTLKVARTEMLESPLATISPLKPDVRRRLDEIAAESRAHIAVINIEFPGGGGVAGQVLATAGGQTSRPMSVTSALSVNGLEAGKPPSEPRRGSGGSSGYSVNGAAESPSDPGAASGAADEEKAHAGNGSSHGNANGIAAGPSVTKSAPVTYGLETERMCELVVTGAIESVEIAKVRLLVMLDELSGLHSEVCDIDYKLHSIIASRKRCVIQSIQEETATNIYYPTPLVGVLNPPQRGSHQGIGYRNMGGLSHQPTGATHLGMQMTGGMGMGIGGAMNGMAMPMAQQLTGMSMGSMGSMSSMGGIGGMNGLGGMPGMNGGMGMGMGGMGSGGMNNGYGGHHRNQTPTYNPHQHVQYPYQPQPLDFNPSTTRGLPYVGAAAQHVFPPMNGLGPMRPNHTGMSQVQTGYQGNRGMASPIPPMNMGMTGMNGQMGVAGGMSPEMGLNMGPGHGPGIGHAHGPARGQGPPMMHSHHNPHPHHHPPPLHSHLNPPAHHPGMHNAAMGIGPRGSMGGGNGMTMPYSNTGQSNVHVGLGGGGGGGIGEGTSMHGGMQMGMGGAPLGGGGGMVLNPTGAHVGQYGSDPHPGLSIHSGEQGMLGKASQIWITGEFFGVQRARDMLLHVAMQKSRLVISRDTAILPRKLDWLLTERIEEVKNIMSDNGTYIQAPSVGSQASLITVFGDHRVNIERSIRSIMGLTCQFYIASFWLLPVSFDVLMPQASLNPAQMQPVLKRIAHATGSEVVFKSNCFEMHGLEQEVRAAVMMVLELDVVHNFHHEIRFQIELANEHRDFISGKKNGKINKIMKLAGVRIKFETFNDYNFLMDVSGTDVSALHGLSMLQEELPAEVSFHVPETYHKRIIGVGGKNIQRIMKLYGVYVKFSNAEEFAQLGGYLDNDDNVVARTPAKNAINLDSLKQSVMELVSPKDKDYTVESVAIPRQYHRTLLGEKSIFIHDIEQKTNSIVRFPYKESASDIVTIFGPESQVHIAAAMLLDHVPFEADLHVPPNADLTRLVTSTEFILFSEQVKRDHQIAIVPSAKFGQGDEAIFKFRCQRSNIDFLGTARDSLEEFLKEHNIQVFSSHAHKRLDTFADAFSHFNSKLLATRASAADGESLIERRPRPGPTDVKALFDGPGQAAPFQPSEDTSSMGFATYDPRRMSEIWTPASAAAIPAPPRSDNDPSKRDSDPIIQEKMRQASTGHGHPGSHPRGASARTQSLDITSLNFSRSLLGSQPFGAMPPSPTAGTSPDKASGQFFPTHHVHPASQGRGFSFDAGLDGVTQGLSNVQVSHQ